MWYHLKVHIVNGNMTHNFIRYIKFLWSLDAYMSDVKLILRKLPFYTYTQHLVYFYWVMFNANMAPNRNDM